MYVVLQMPIDSRYHVTEEQQQKELDIINSAKEEAANFAPLYEKYYESILRFIHKRIDDKDNALDITSQVFLKAMSNLNKYEYRGVPFSSWLYRIANNEVVTFIKKNEEKRCVNIDTTGVHEIVDDMETFLVEQQHEKLTKIISNLPEDDLQLIEMRFFEKRAFKEIGEILDITENNAKVKVYRVIDKLKKMITVNE
jgi:RNA polymerase sigma-70 factor (ECF subfamily)